MATLEKAVEIAARAHSGQVDKAGQPYILHPLRLMLSLPGADERIAAVLHDVVEDTPVTLSDLASNGFSEAVLSAVALLTHDPAVAYFDYVRLVAAHPVARAVKMADLRDNLDISRISAPSEKDIARLEKYREALAILAND